MEKCRKSGVKNNKHKADFSPRDFDHVNRDEEHSEKTKGLRNSTPREMLTLKKPASVIAAAAFGASLASTLFDDLQGLFYAEGSRAHTMHQDRQLLLTQRRLRLPIFILQKPAV
jgi:hypothetical protein